MSRTLKCLFVAGALIAITGACAPNPSGDKLKPQILSVTVTPSEVTPGESMTVSAFVTDTTAVTGVAFTLRRDGKTALFCGGAATLVDGTAQAGTWERTCVVPVTVNSGQYQINSLAVDRALNFDQIGDIEESERSGHFTMLGDIFDDEAPVVSSVTVTPAEAPIGEQVVISAHVTDATGVSAVGFTPRRDGNVFQWCAGGATLVSGTNTDGVWERTCIIPADVELGEYAITTAFSDLLGNIGGLGEVTEPGPTSGHFTVVEALPPVDPPVDPPVEP